MIGEYQEAAFLKTLTLLYVEDDPYAREEVAEFLQRRAGKVIIAADGEAGLAAFQAEPAQIVVTDIQMPKLNGLAMARQILELAPATPIIVTTAFEQTDYLMTSIALGIDQYVLKPIQAERLEFALLISAHRLLADEQLRQKQRLEAEAMRMRHQQALSRLLEDIAQEYQGLLQEILNTMAQAEASLDPAGDVSRILRGSRKTLDQACFLGHRLLTLVDPSGQRAVVGALDDLIRRTVQESLAGSPVTAAFRFQAQAPVHHSEPDLVLAFRSLAENAREAMPGGGTLQVSTEFREGRGGPGDRLLQVLFQDSGPGIPPENLPLVFEPYFSTKARAGFEVNGLGLALCGTIIRSHGGTISVDSPPGGGTAIRIQLPLALGDRA